MRIALIRLALILELSASSAIAARADGGEEWREFFTPRKPTVVLRYDLSYCFLGIHLKSLATAVIRSTDGIWSDANPATAKVPVTMLELVIRTRDRERGDLRSRISIDRKTVSVVTTPAMEALLLVVAADDSLRPVLGSDSRTHYEEVYDLRSGGLRFSRTDCETGMRSTNLVGATDLAGQGRAVADLLSAVADVYGGRSSRLGGASGLRLFVNIDGITTPFVAGARYDSSPVSLKGKSPRCLRVDIRPAPEAGRRGRAAAVWTTGFRELAALTDNPDLIRIAEESQPFVQAPLGASYGLALGSIRALMLGEPFLASWDDSADSPSEAGPNVGSSTALQGGQKDSAPPDKVDVVCEESPDRDQRPYR
jgi:hypothetical protein